ncbi:hypothetical protein N4P33_05485 [Streptomyces sp. 15-116A]|uniref:hypothetical protein n=1 Tax=Streptomyces sp. 15-116A TaxID=2259035 RepID=UPI0021B3C242|nr:hypothetical protein [Streptomyces sp. 15-116A]MCT7351622.1 hypothetical protein [Streptomyces sp. 15-116A]
MPPTPETVEVDFITPRHLAGGGDPAWIPVPLHRACGWSHGNDPLMPRVLLSSLCSLPPRDPDVVTRRTTDVLAVHVATALEERVHALTAPHRPAEHSRPAAPAAGREQPQPLNAPPPPGRHVTLCPPPPPTVPPTGTTSSCAS